MKRTNVREVQLQRSAQSLRQERHALPQAFSIAHSDLLVTEVDVFDAQTQTLLYGAGLHLMELGDGSDSLVYREMSEKFGDFLLPPFHSVGVSDERECNSGSNLRTLLRCEWSNV